MKVNDNDWGIELTGRRMLHEPWHLDKNGNYVKPSDEEIREIYGISGEAINETLLFFEKCGGNSANLIQLLNDHVIDKRFIEDRESLLDKSRWYTNEYYFYFIMFTKKLMGDYNWRFTKGENVQLSKYHKIYEIGHLRFIPYGHGSEKDSSSAVQKAVFKCYEKKGYSSVEFFRWIDIITRKKTSISFKEDIIRLESYWLCNEFVYFLFEFGNIILNKNNMLTIAGESFDFFDFAEFSYVPESMLLKILSFIFNKSTNLYNMKVKRNRNNMADFYFTISEKYNKKEDIYQSAYYEMNHSINIACFPKVIKKLLKLNKLPEVKNLSGFGTEICSFTLKWEKRILSIPYLQLLIFNLATAGLMIINTILKMNIILPILMFLLPMNIILIFMRKLKIEKNKKNIAEEHNIKVNEDNRKRLEKLEELSVELIHEKEKLEEKVVERTKELALANEKLKELDMAKTNFFANVTHELRTPLTLILGPLEAILSGEFGTTFNYDDEKFKIMLYNGIKLLNLISNLLDFTKLEVGKMKVNKKNIKIAELLRFYVATVKSSAENRGLKIFFNNNTNDRFSNDGDLIVSLDNDLFEKAIFNLISNSLKFTPETGEIIVQLDREVDTFSVSVKDNGIGIPENKLDEIFERFSQIDNSASRKYEGTGIGLALTKEIVEILGGTISVKSKINKGSVFTIAFPLRNDDISANEPEKMRKLNSYLLPELNDNTGSLIDHPSDFDSNNGKKECDRKILVVEDNKDMQKYIKLILHKDFHMMFANNGREGIEKAAKEKPDLILSDVMMPEMDGYEMTEKIKKIDYLADIPIILLTAKADSFMKLEGFKKGASDYIIKPFDAYELKARLNAQFEMKSLRDRISKQKNMIQKTLDEKIAAQRLLEQSERRLREMIDYLPVAVIEEDLIKIRYMNHYAKNLLKIESISLKQIQLIDFIEGEDKKYFAERINKLKNEKNLDLYEFNLMIKDRNKVKVLIKTVPYFEKNKLSYLRYTILEIQPNINLTLLSNNDFYHKYNISEREKEILDYLLQGYRNKDIAEKIFLSEAGVKKHISNLYDKINVKNRSELLKIIALNIKY